MKKRKPSAHTHTAIAIKKKHTANKRNEMKWNERERKKKSMALRELNAKRMSLCTVELVACTCIFIAVCAMAHKNEI